jgi:pilus assembly protein CpaF
MFTIVISEKGGAERRETFEKNEINVGRVQGNDLMLPKGNVSKHHARLLFRDARFIVTDLKSTNGTYVNGRKISQATIVREGDKIYIGDFVLRLETGGFASQNAGDSYDSQGRTPARSPSIPREAVPAVPPPLQTSPPQPQPVLVSPAPPPQPLPAPPPLVTPSAGGLAPTVIPGVSPPPSPSPSGQLPISSGAPPSPVIGAAVVSPQRLPEQSVSHFPLERDPDDSEAAPELVGAPVPHVPGPPRMPTPDPARVVPRTGTALIMPQDKPAVPANSPSALAGAPAMAKRSAPPPPADVRPLPRELPQYAVRALALRTLVERVMDSVDPASLAQPNIVDDDLAARLERTVREQAKAMRDGGQAAEGIDLEPLARDALRELLGLGPIGPLLADDDATEIHVLRPEYVLVWKGGEAVLADAPFTSPEALARVVRRLANQSGEPLREGEVLVERMLVQGAHLVAVGPPLGKGWVLSIRKRRRIEATMEGLVRAGSLSRPIASFLDACVSARLNVLVVGSGAGAVATAIAALASAFPASERVVVIQDVEDLVIDQTQVAPIALPDYGQRGEETVRAASRLLPDRLVVTSLGGSVTAAVVEAIGGGAEGVVAGVHAPSTRRALGRLPSQIALARSGTSADAAREALGECFDLAVEIVRLGDGRLRVQRVSELDVAERAGGITLTPRDIFVLQNDASGESALTATGVIPKVKDDLAARGVRLDAALFRKR